MPDSDPKPTRPPSRRRRRRPTRPNVYVTVFGAPLQPVTEPDRAVKAEPAEVRSEIDEPLVSTEWLERRSKRLDTFEQELRQRQLELDRREAELEEKEARLEADLYLREDDLEARERKLDEREQRIGRRESEIGSYVARLQGGFLRADAV